MRCRNSRNEKNMLLTFNKYKQMNRLTPRIIQFRIQRVNTKSRNENPYV
jgi:hypothetical protein